MLISFYFLCVTSIVVAAQQGLRGLVEDFPRSPVVGILALPPNAGTPFSYIREYNVKFLESAGVQAVPLHYDDPNLKSLLAQISGVLLTGGSINEDLRVGHPYVDAAKMIYDYAVDRHAKNDPFPIFGICQGHQLLALLAAGTHEVILGGQYTTRDVALPLKFANGGGEMLNSLPSDVREILQTQNVTAHAHFNGVPPGMWDEYDKLREQFIVTSTSEDPVNHKVFTSTLESRPGKAPMYSVQFHPEMVNYVWDPTLMEGVLKTVESTLVVNSVALFVGKIFRGKPHRFPNAAELSKSLFRPETILCPSYTDRVHGYCRYNLTAYGSSTA